jgi:adenylate cyclase
MALMHVSEQEVVDGQIAEHFERAGLPLQALPYYERAAISAKQVFAHLDAIHYLNRALQMLETMEVTAEHSRQELRLLLMLVTSWAVFKGNAAPEVVAALERAESLSLQVGDDLQQLKVLQWKALALFNQYRVDEAYAVSQQRMPLVQRLGDPRYLVEATLQLGVLTELLGHFRRSQTHFEMMLAHTDYQWSRANTTILEQDPIVAAKRHLAIVLWFLGYPDAARRKMEEAWADVHAGHDLNTQGGVLIWAALLALYCREVERTQQYAEAAIALATEWSFGAWLSNGKFFLGWALVQQNQLEKGLALMDAEIEKRNRTKTRNPELLLYLATVYGEAGEVEKALSLLEQALATSTQEGRRSCLAELYRVRGVMLQASGADTNIVEASFLEALAVASQQEAKSLELRAAMSLSRLWSEQGRRHEAHSLLAEVYGWFTEGFDTHDLREAQILLEQLE